MRRLRDLVRRLLASPGARRALAGVSMATASLLCAIAEAAGGGGQDAGHGAPHLNLWTWDDHAPPIGWFFFDFLVFVGLLVYLTRKPIKQRARLVLTKMVLRYIRDNGVVRLKTEQRPVAFVRLKNTNTRTGTHITGT